MRKNFFTGRVQAVKQAAQESGAGVGVQIMSRCGTTQYGLLGTVAFS